MNIAMKVLVAAVGVLPTFPVSVANAQSPTIHYGCVSKHGALSIVSETTICKDTETRIFWNQTGPQGPAGPQGPQGPAGAGGGRTWLAANGAIVGTSNGPSHVSVTLAGARITLLVTVANDYEALVVGGTTAPVYFAGLNCMGQAYVVAKMAGDDRLWGRLYRFNPATGYLDQNSILLGANQPATPIQAQSVATFPDYATNPASCATVPGGTKTVSAVPAEATFDLNQLWPPPLRLQ